LELYRPRVGSQLYNLDCIAYESMLLGLFTIGRGQPGPREKPNEVCVGFSRGGFHGPGFQGPTDTVGTGVVA
jgi:hypothetical protein